MCCMPAHGFVSLNILYVLQSLCMLGFRCLDSSGQREFHATEDFVSEISRIRATETRLNIFRADFMGR